MTVSKAKLNNQALRLITGVMAFIFLLYSHTALADLQRILIVSSLSSKAQTEFIVSLNNNLSSAKTQVGYTSPDSIPEDNVDIYIVAGLNAAITAARKLKNKNVIYTLLSTEQFIEIRKLAEKNNQHYKVLYLEQPFSRNLKIIKTILPEVQSIGFITSSNSPDLINSLSNQASGFNLEFASEKVENVENIFNHLTQLLPRCELLLTSYDNKIYNRNTIKNILLTSYYRNIPIVGFSESFLHAGAYISIYTTASQYGVQSASLIEMFSSGQSRQEFYPDEYVVKINQSIARSLSLPYYTSDQLSRMLK